MKTIIFTLMLLSLTSPALAEDQRQVYDKDYSLQYRVYGDKVYDKDYNLKYRIQDGKVYDRDYNLKYRTPGSERQGRERSYRGGSKGRK